MKKLLPILAVILALGGGAGAGLFLAPKDACAAATDTADTDGSDMTANDMAEDCITDGTAAKEKEGKPTEFTSLSRQFVIPVMRGGQVEAMVVATLALDNFEGTSEAAYSAEPKLRDAFLQVFFIHAHSGGFDGAFTQAAAMSDLRERLYEVAEPVLGNALIGVLITDIVRQDL